MDTTKTAPAVAGANGGPSAPPAAAPDGQAKTGPPPAARRAILIAGVILVIIALFYGVRFLIYALAHQSTDDAKIDADQVQITSKISERVNRLLVDTNQYVHRGQLLVLLDDRDETTRYNNAAAALAADQGQARAALATVGLTHDQQVAQNQQNTGAIAQARAGVSSASAQAQAAQAAERRGCRERGGRRGRPAGGPGRPAGRAPEPAQGAGRPQPDGVARFDRRLLAAAARRVACAGEGGAVRLRPGASSGRRGRRELPVGRAEIRLAGRERERRRGDDRGQSGRARDGAGTPGRKLRAGARRRSARERRRRTRAGRDGARAGEDRRRQSVVHEDPLADRRLRRTEERRDRPDRVARHRRS